ncbi:MAG: hypothetical protein RAO94_00750 [Candidatus Stygibacter australis]|nr:hypothetical protein [Candidatus Stygibacter australis]MDP8320856.1 hypothetical protein [Candidatus Stygibacter australis]
MQKYRDIDHDSGVSAYEYGQDWIRVQFRDGSVYEYRSEKAGQGNINMMKQLADAGDGLNSFINKEVKFKYSKKIR